MEKSDHRLFKNFSIYRFICEHGQTLIAFYGFSVMLTSTTFLSYINKKFPFFRERTIRKNINYIPDPHRNEKKEFEYIISLQRKYLRVVYNWILLVILILLIILEVWEEKKENREKEKKEKKFPPQALALLTNELPPESYSPKRVELLIEHWDKMGVENSTTDLSKFFGCFDVLLYTPTINLEIENIKIFLFQFLDIKLTEEQRKIEMVRQFVLRKQIEQDKFFEEFVSPFLESEYTPELGYRSSDSKWIIDKYREFYMERNMCIDYLEVYNQLNDLYIREGVEREILFPGANKMYPLFPGKYFLSDDTSITNENIGKFHILLLKKIKEPYFFMELKESLKCVGDMDYITERFTLFLKQFIDMFRQGIFKDAEDFFIKYVSEYISIKKEVVFTNSQTKEVYKKIHDEKYELVLEFINNIYCSFFSKHNHIKISKFQPFGVKTRQLVSRVGSGARSLKVTLSGE